MSKGNSHPEDCRICFSEYETRFDLILHYADDHTLTYDRIARLMDYARHSIGPKLSAARKRLRLAAAAV